MHNEPGTTFGLTRLQHRAVLLGLQRLCLSQLHPRRTLAPQRSHGLLLRHPEHIGEVVDPAITHVSQANPTLLHHHAKEETYCTASLTLPLTTSNSSKHLSQTPARLFGSTDLILTFNLALTGL